MESGRTGGAEEDKVCPEQSGGSLPQGAGTFEGRQMGAVLRDALPGPCVAAFSEEALSKADHCGSGLLWGAFSRGVGILCEVSGEKVRRENDAVLFQG